MGEIIGFNKDGAKRVIAATRAVERHWGNELGPNGQNNFHDSIFIAKITSNDGGSPAQYAWTEQRRTSTGFEDMPEGRTGTTTEKYAIAYNESDATDCKTEDDTIALMIYTSNGSSDPFYTFFPLVKREVVTDVTCEDGDLVVTKEKLWVLGFEEIED